MESEERRNELKLKPLEELRPEVPPKLATYNATRPKSKEFLQALFDCAPTPSGQHYVAVEILSCKTDACLDDLVKRYWDMLIMPIRAAGGKTPPVSDHPSRPSADLDALINAALVEPANVSRSTMRDLVLRRDDYRCVVSGRADYSAFVAGRAPLQQSNYTAVDNAHILPFSLMPGSDEQTVRDRSGAIWQVISAFSSIPLDVLNGGNINRPQNGIALDHMLHSWFGGLSLCLEPTDVPDTYRVLTWGPQQILSISLGFPNTVSFVSRAGVPVPDRRLLALHAACAKVIHQSGMAEILDKVLEDLEQITVLSSDGSSADLLHHALAMVAVQ